MLRLFKNVTSFQRKKDLSICTPIFMSSIFRLTMEPVHTVKVVPRRRRLGDGTYAASLDPNKNRKIILTLAEVEVRVHLPLREAALSLGISSTTLKKTCRHFGIPRWPYRRRGTSSSRSSSERSKKEAPPTADSMWWDPHTVTHPLCTDSMWWPHAATHPLCTDSGLCQGTDEGCDLWFLACDCSPRCGPLCIDSSLWL